MEKMRQMKKLAIDVLKLLWQYCQEDSISLNPSDGIQSSTMVLNQPQFSSTSLP